MSFKNCVTQSDFQYCGFFLSWLSTSKHDLTVPKYNISNSIYIFLDSHLDTHPRMCESTLRPSFGLSKQFSQNKSTKLATYSELLATPAEFMVIFPAHGFLLMLQQY